MANVMVDQGVLTDVVLFRDLSPDALAAISAAASPLVLARGDVVFSLDSVITAVGMADDVPVMIVAMLVAVLAMMAFAPAIGGFVEKHPTVKVLALSFLMLIGVVLIADGLGQHIGKGYVYSAMAFSLVVEMLNLRLRARAKARRQTS